MTEPTDINEPRLRRKRAARLAAMTRRANRPPIGGLSRERLVGRTKLAEREQAALAALAQWQPPVPLYCRRTGALLGSLNESLMPALDRIANGADDTTAAFEQFTTARFTHPAFLDTSPARLRELMRVLPREFAVFAAHELRDSGATGAQRHQILAALNAVPLADVVETGELLRVALGLFGRFAKRTKYSVAGRIVNGRSNTDYPPAIADYRESFSTVGLRGYCDTLRAWIIRTVNRLQESIHRADLNRARVVTLADVRNVAAEFGMQSFRQARGTKQDDDSLLPELTEIFGDVDPDAVGTLRTAIAYNRPRRIANAPVPTTVRPAVADKTAQSVAQSVTGPIRLSLKPSPATATNAAPLRLKL